MGTPELGQGLGLVGGCRQVRMGLDQAGRDVRRHVQQGLGALGGDQEADHARQARRAVVLAREAHGHADGEQQAQVGEDRVAGGGHEGDVQQVGLAQPQQQPGHRQHGDGQHQGAAQGLEEFERGLHRLGSSAWKALQQYLGRPRARSGPAPGGPGPGRPARPGCADQRLHLRHGRGRGRQFGDAQADQHRHGRRGRRPGRRRRRPSAGARAAPLQVWSIIRSTAGCRASMRAASSGLPRSMASTYWVRSLVPIDRKSASAAIRSAVTAAAGRLDHHPQLDPLGDPHLALGFLEHGADGAQLVEAGDHRDHDLALAQRLDPQDGAQLGLQQVRPPQRHAHAAQAQGRVLLGRDRQVGRGLVAADVQGADDQRTAVQGRGDGLVLAGLFVLVGRGLALQEQELGAQQARAFRAVRRRRPGRRSASRRCRTPRCARRRRCGFPGGRRPWRRPCARGGRRWRSGRRPAGRRRDRPARSRSRRPGSGPRPR